jgi:hypothetical protein
MMADNTLLMAIHQRLCVVKPGIIEATIHARRNKLKCGLCPREGGVARGVLVEDAVFHLALALTLSVDSLKWGLAQHRFSS